MLPWAERDIDMDNQLRITMPRAAFKARLRKWGNTYGLTVSPSVVRRLKAAEGMELTVEASTEPMRADYSDVAVLHGPDARGSRDHDRLIGEAAEKEAKRWRRRA